MTSTTTSRRRMAVGVAAAATALVLSGCSAFGDGGSDDAPPKKPASSVAPDPSGEAEPLPPGKSGEPHGGIPSPADVDQTDATAVSEAALTGMFTYDTAIDTSRNDAGRRIAAAGWCTATYAAELKEAATRSAPGTGWTLWDRHQAYTTATLQQTEEAGKPADTDTDALRQWTITITPTGRDGWKGAAESRTAYVELIRPAAGKPWRLNAVTVQ
ncbi:hypothetical protein [Streptomyces sp. NBC_00134]|uniref:hypothetical protein n=1 Tax=Streptomyces sp. NBC_00134 TaxID=2975663 RepID=UPI0032431505